MAVYPVTASEFESLLQTHAMVFVDFWAEWCAPCKHFAHVYEKVSEQYPDIRFASVNVEKEPEFAEWFSINSIPHLMVFKQGIAIYSDSGSMPESNLRELADQTMAVDMQDLVDGEE